MDQVNSIRHEVFNVESPPNLIMEQFVTLMTVKLLLYQWAHLASSVGITAHGFEQECLYHTAACIASLGIRRASRKQSSIPVPVWYHDPNELYVDSSSRV